MPAYFSLHVLQMEVKMKMLNMAKARGFVRPASGNGRATLLVPPSALRPQVKACESVHLVL